MAIISSVKIFFSFLNIAQKKKVSLVIINLIIQSILEMFGISMVIPVLMIILDPEKFQLSFLSILGFNKKELIFFISISIITFFIIKSIYLYFINKFTFDFAYGVEESLKDNVFSNYIKMEYEDVILLKTSKLINDLTINLKLLTQHFTIPLLILVSETMILLAVLSFLCWYSQVGFLILFFFAFFATVFFSFFLGNLIKNLGKNRERVENSLTGIIQNGIGSLKISKLYNLQDTFIRQFSLLNNHSTILYSKFFTLNQIPRYLLELFGFFLILFITFYFKISGQNTFELVSTIGLFAAAGFKFIPSLNRIIIAIQQIKFSSSVFSSVEEIQNYIKNDLKKVNGNLHIEHVDKFEKIEFKEIFFKFQKPDNLILNNLEFILNKNETVGIMGISGVGKTTFLDIFTGLLRPTSGKILINNKEIILNNSSWKDQIGYVPQNTYLFEGTLLENIVFNEELKNIDLESVKRIIKFTKLDSLTGSNSHGIHMMLSSTQLSGGQIQKIGLARALYRNPNILILDEPTSSLDNETENLIISSLNDLKNITKLIVSHKETTLKYCSRILRLNNGRFIEYKK
jgi:ABC-type multidrug transport system fused ATPase/permease subunit